MIRESKGGRLVDNGMAIDDSTVDEDEMDHLVSETTLKDASPKTGVEGWMYRHWKLGLVVLVVLVNLVGLLLIAYVSQTSPDNENQQPPSAAPVEVRIHSHSKPNPTEDAIMFGVNYAPSESKFDKGDKGDTGDAGPEQKKVNKGEGKKGKKGKKGNKADSIGNIDETGDEGPEQKKGKKGKKKKDNEADSIGNVEDHLHFAILSFEKTGTTSLRTYFEDFATRDPNSEIQMLKGEYHGMAFYPIREPSSLITKMERRLPQGPQYKHAIDANGEFRRFGPLQFYYDYFPKTKLLLGIRHPMSWYESFYNFFTVECPAAINMINYSGEWLMPDVFVGEKCTICPSRSNFAASLMISGKQYESPQRRGKERTLSPLEVEILENQNDEFDWYDPTEREPMPNPIFFYTSEQMTDKDNDRTQNFLADLTTFLDLSDPTLLTSQGMPEHIRPCGDSRKNKMTSPVFNEKLDFCDERFDELRESVMEMSTRTSQWILNEGFLDSPTVSYANRDHLEEILLSYQRDPCLDK